MKIVVINGYPRSGKSTFVEYCKEESNLVYEISMVDYAKIIAGHCGWKGSKTPEDRKFLSSLKDILDEWNDLSYKYVKTFISLTKTQVETYLDSSDNLIIFVHARQPEDIERLKQDYDAITLCIQREPDIKDLSNHADRDVANYIYDIYIDNTMSLDELRTQARNFIAKMKNI